MGMKGNKKVRKKNNNTNHNQSMMVDPVPPAQWDTEETPAEKWPEEPLLEEPLPEQPPAEKWPEGPLLEESLPKEPLPEEPLPEEPLPEESLPEEPLPEEPLPEESLPEEPLPKEPLPESPCDIKIGKCDTIEPPPAIESEIFEYAQPESCPYEGQAVTVLIGPSEKHYTIPKYLLDQAPALRSSLAQDGSLSIKLADVNEDIGHTLMHYLYTGDFQTQKAPPVCKVPKQKIEYTRSVLAYRIAVTYGLSGLEKHAKRYMEMFDRDISIIEIIALAQKTFPGITGDLWYSNYLSTKIVAEFMADEGIFQQNEFIETFGKTLNFDKFLVKVMALAYSSKISALRNEVASNNMNKAYSVSSGDSKDDTMDDKENVVDSHCDMASIVQADAVNSEEQFLYPEPEPELNLTQEALPNASSPDPCTELESELFDHFDPKCDAGLDLGMDGSSEKAESLQISIITPDSDIIDHAEVDSTSRRDLVDCACPKWEVHSLDENIWKSCKGCRGYLHNMLARLVDI